MQKNLLSLFSGLVFGFGVSLSGMTNPNTVIHFLDITGDWDVSLVFVLCSAVLTTVLGFRWVLKQPQPVCDMQFHLPTKHALDAKLIIGSAIFGVGWGLAGYCPGAAIAALATLNSEVYVFVVAMLVGLYFSKKLNFG
jgi:uncharacterized membrane protein YedE/YeeE